MTVYKRPCGNENCPGYFINIENGKVEKCDLCKLFTDDHEAKHYYNRVCELKEKGVDLEK